MVSFILKNILTHFELREFEAATVSVRYDMAKQFFSETYMQARPPPRNVILERNKQF